MCSGRIGCSTANGGQNTKTALQLSEAGMTPTTIRFSVGDEDPSDLIRHLKQTARLTIDGELPGFSDGFPDQAATKTLIRECYMSAHERFIDARLDEVSADS